LTALRRYCVVFALFCAVVARTLRITQNADGGGFMEKFLWIKEAGQFSQGSPEEKRDLNLRRIVI